MRSAGRCTGVPDEVDTLVLFEVLRSMIALRQGLNLTLVLVAVRGDPAARDVVFNLVQRLDRVHGLLFMLGATDVEPEDEVAQALADEGYAVRQVPQYAGVADEAGDHAAEE